MQQLQYIKSHLINYDTQLMNQSTLWARAIYPLLLLAEHGNIQSWCEVPLHAQYVQFEIESIADGVLAKTVAGRIETPYLIVVETKKGIEGQNPVFQWYGQLLAAAHLNFENDGQPTQEIFSCYTIANTWKFVRTEVKEMESDRPLLRVEYSTREY